MKADFGCALGYDGEARQKRFWLPLLVSGYLAAGEHADIARVVEVPEGGLCRGTDRRGAVCRKEGL